jgi:hypothetical protein
MPETSEQKETESSVTKSPSMIPVIRSALLVSILSLVSDFGCVPGHAITSLRPGDGWFDLGDTDLAFVEQSHLQPRILDRLALTGGDFFTFPDTLSVWRHSTITKLMAHGCNCR